MVVSSHQLEEVERICDAVVILDQGVVVRAGRLSELRRPGGAVLVEVDERAEELAVLLRATGLEVESDAGPLLVSGGEGVYDVVRDAVADLGVGLRRLERKSQTLEELYLEASR